MLKLKTLSQTKNILKPKKFLNIKRKKSLNIMA